MSHCVMENGARAVPAEFMAKSMPPAAATRQANCKNGVARATRASSLAARDLRTLGFTRAGDVIDGFAGWCRAGLPTLPEPTRQVR